MYIIKNAFKCISRAKGRNALIGLIVLVIAVSACLGLSIRQAAENARDEMLEGMSVTATISFDRQSMMNEMGRPEEGSNGKPAGGFDRSEFTQAMKDASAMSLEEYQKYSKAQSVKDFYYSLSASLNGSDSFEPVNSQDDTSSGTSSNKTSANVPGGMMGGRNPMSFVMGMESDFSVIGYSSEAAMSDFISGTSAVTSGSIFEEGGTSLECIISEELAAFNDVSVGDAINLTNPNSEEENYELSVVGIYADSSANESSFSMMGMTSTDPANKIYMSYNALQKIIEASEGVSTTQTDEDTGRTFETALTGSLSATYVLADVDAFESFEQEVRDLGLEDDYVVSSQDLNAFENSMMPLETLSKTAGYFLIVILVIGAVILIVLNIFNVRERKYEIGVLTAMGMKKSKVSIQFMIEIFAVALAAIIIGIAVGGICSVPVTNALLENQVTSQSAQSNRIEQNFGRGEAPQAPPEIANGKNDFMNPFADGGFAREYITEINSAMNFTVVLQMLGIAVVLSIVSGMASMLFVMRYEPLKILANRD